jgi:hypothetical protein
MIIIDYRIMRISSSRCYTILFVKHQFIAVLDSLLELNVLRGLEGHEGGKDWK